MVSGHLQEKNGYFHMVLNLKDDSGKRMKKWITTGLPIKGNKKKAEQMLIETRQSYEANQSVNIPEKAEAVDLLFSDYLREWLRGIRPNIEVSTYSAYFGSIKKISGYFDDKRTTLKDLTAKDIQGFYTHSLSEWKVSSNTVIHYHANIRKALQSAVKMNLITANPALNVERPKKQKYTGSFYDVEMINELLGAVKGTYIEFAVMFAAFYGLRRSEIVGLKWDAIDFKSQTITIKHTVLETTVDGKYQIIAKDRAKTKSSMRSLPLVAGFEEYLLNLKEKQKAYKRLCGNCYNYDYDGYIYVDEMGNLTKPGFVTQNFSIILENNKLRKIRFHDLRHSCASLLLANGVSLKEIQEWLGHSTFATTADIYAHLDKSTKTVTASAMLQSGIKIGNESKIDTSGKSKGKTGKKKKPLK
jgi:integrase